MRLFILLGQGQQPSTSGMLGGGTDQRQTSEGRWLPATGSDLGHSFSNPLVSNSWVDPASAGESGEVGTVR